MHTRVLVVEDDPSIAMILRDNLTIDGFAVRCAATSAEALAACQTFPPDIVLLDLMLGTESGYDLCQALRGPSNRPVIMVTARSQRADRVRGFQAGADDYVTKPFDMEELVARIRAVMRRARPDSKTITLGHVVVDYVTRRATRAGRALHLTDREFDIPQYMATRGVVHRNQLLTDVWGVVSTATTRSVDFAIWRLRRKLEVDPHHPQFIQTVHGDGYRLTTDQARHD